MTKLWTQIRCAASMGQGGGRDLREEDTTIKKHLRERWKCSLSWQYHGHVTPNSAARHKGRNRNSCAAPVLFLHVSCRAALTMVWHILQSPKKNRFFKKGTRIKKRKLTFNNIWKLSISSLTQYKICLESHKTQNRQKTQHRKKKKPLHYLLLWVVNCFQHLMVTLSFLERENVKAKYYFIPENLQYHN